MNMKLVGRPKSEFSLSNADRQRAFRLKQKQNKAVLSETIDNIEAFNPLSDLGELSNDEIDLIKKLIKDNRAPKHQSLAGLYANIVKECHRKNICDATLVDIETLYFYVGSVL